VAVKIRLKRMGKIRQPYYRIVVADSRTKRDGRVIEEIGKYHPKQEPSFIEVDSDRVQYWLGVGAQPSEPVAAILKVTGDWQKFKGEPAPEAMKVAEPKRDKTEIFNEALKDSVNEPQTAAVTPKRAAAKKAEPPAAEPTAATVAEAVDAPAADGAEAPAEEAPAAEAPSGQSESVSEAPEAEATVAAAVDAPAADAAEAADAAKAADAAEAADAAKAADAAEAAEAPAAESKSAPEAAEEADSSEAASDDKPEG
jgi:small subunit ribosomal protein S16